MEILRPTAGSNIWICRRRLQTFRIRDYLSQVLGTTKDKTCELVTYLVLCPLRQARAAALALTRQGGEEIDPLADLQGEETPPPVTRPRQPKGSGRRHKSPVSRKTSELSTVTSTPRLATEEDEDSEPWIRDLVLGLLPTLPSDIQDFLPVQKRKKREAPKRIDSPVKRTAPRIRKSESKSKDCQPLLPVHKVEIICPVNSAYRLHSDLVDFQTIVGERLEAASIMRLLLTENIQELVKSRFSKAKAEVYGSYATQLALPTSDLDLVIEHRKIQGRESTQQAVRTLAAMMAQQPFAKDLEVLDSAAIPLLKLKVDCGYFAGVGDLKVDISFTKRRAACTHSGLISAQYVRELIAVRPGLRSLVLALKQLLTLHGLNCAYTGGLSSYALFIWTAAYIGEAPCSDYGKMLIGFLSFYGREFDPRATGISLSDR